MADQFTQAVLAKAFRAELVPTEAALARIRAEPRVTCTTRERQADPHPQAEVRHRRNRMMTHPSPTTIALQQN